MHSLTTQHFSATAQDFGDGTGGTVPVLAGPQFASPFILQSIVWNRVSTNGINIVVSALSNGTVYDIDRVTGLTDRFYVFPNIRVPHPLAFNEDCRIIFSTVGEVSDLQQVLINWSQIGI